MSIGGHSMAGIPRASGRIPTRSWLRTGRLMLSIGWETGPGLFLGFVLVGLAGTLGPLTFALGLRPLVNGLYQHHGSQAAWGAVVCSLALLLVAGTPAAQNWLTARIRQRAITAMQRRILVATSNAPGLEHFERPAFFERLQVLKRSFVNLLMGMANALILPLVVVQLLVCAGVLAAVNPFLVCLPLIALPAAALTQRAELIRIEADEAAAADRRGLEHLASVASRVESGKEIRVFGLRTELLERHRELTRRVERTTESAGYRAYLLGLLGWLIFAAAFVGAAAAALRAAAEGRIGPGDVALTLSITAAVVAAAVRLTEVIGLLKRATTVADSYYWLVEQTADPLARETAAPVPERLERGIELRGASFSYAGAPKPSLSEVDLLLPAGSVVAIVGENGAGKTTLVKLLTRMYRPAAGRVLLDGADAEQMDVRAYRRRVTAGFQDFMRFEFLLSEAVGVGDLPRMREPGAVERAMDAAGVDFLDRLEHGRDTQLGSAWEGGTELSGGQWQKVALARAMMPELPLLTVYDEPTSSLDPQTEHALFEQIARSVRDGAAVGGVTVLVSHRFSTVRMADLIVVLDGGRVREAGSHEELMDRAGLYAELYSLQASAYS